MTRDAILTCAQKLTQVSLMYHTEPKAKQWKKEKLKSKNGEAQKYRYTVRRISGVNPEEEKEGYDGRICRKGRF